MECEVKKSKSVHGDTRELKTYLVLAKDSVDQDYLDYCIHHFHIISAHAQNILLAMNFGAKRFVGGKINRIHKIHNILYI